MLPILRDVGILGVVLLPGVGRKIAARRSCGDPHDYSHEKSNPWYTIDGKTWHFLSRCGCVAKILSFAIANNKINKRKNQHTTILGVVNGP